MNAEQFAQYGQNNLFLLLPRGAHNVQNDGVLTVVDDDSIDRVMGAFVAGNDILVDETHNSLDPEERSTAMGWVTALYADERGVWGQIRWTDIGLQHILSGAYRFLSPYCAIEQLSDDVCMPTAIESVALTNIPGLEGMPPLTTFDDDVDRLTNDEVEEVENTDPETAEYLRLRPVTNRLRNRDDEGSKAEYARKQIAANWVQTDDGSTFNNWLELCRLLNLDGETVDDQDVKNAIAARQHTHRSILGHGPAARTRIGIGNRGEPGNWVRRRNKAADLLVDQLCNNRSTKAIRQLASQYGEDSYMKRKMFERAAFLDNRGSLDSSRNDSNFRGNEKPGTRTESFAGPVCYSREPIARPEPRLRWQIWSNGMPNFDGNADVENQQRLERMADQLCKKRSVRQIRALANQHQNNFYLRSALSKRADLLDEEERSKRVNNRTAHRPLGFTETLANRYHL